LRPPAAGVGLINAASSETPLSRWKLPVRVGGNPLCARRRAVARLFRRDHEKARAARTWIGSICRPARHSHLSRAGTLGVVGGRSFPSCGNRSEKSSGPMDRDRVPGRRPGLHVVFGRSAPICGWTVLRLCRGSCVSAGIAAAVCCKPDRDGRDALASPVFWRGSCRVGSCGSLKRASSHNVAAWDAATNCGRPSPAASARSRHMEMCSSGSGTTSRRAEAE